MDRPTFLSDIPTRLLIAATLVAIVAGVQTVIVGGYLFVGPVLAYPIAYTWIARVRDFVAERRWFEGGMTGDRPKQRLDTRASIFLLALSAAMLAYFTWSGFRHDEW
jgi:hypothetical protein